jgi:hypothetical protein
LNSWFEPELGIGVNTAGWPSHFKAHRFTLSILRHAAAEAVIKQDNLALACPGCNLRKTDRVDATDPETGRFEPLFHPRREDWSAHFAWNGMAIVGTSSVGRATVSALDLNHDRRLMIRRAELAFGLFPPPTPEHAQGS